MDWNSFIAGFHPLLVHLPIGFVILAIFFEGMSWIKGRSDSLTWIVDWSLFLSIIATSFSIFTGLMMVKSAAWSGMNLDIHRSFGFGLLFFLIVLGLAKRRYPHYNKGYSLAGSTLLLTLISVTGHMGGTLTHGEDSLTALIRPSKTVDFKNKEDSLHVFSDFIQPVFDQKCVGCHNPSYPSGRIILTSYEDIIRSGDSELLVSGKPFESELLKRVTMNPASKKFMPPTGNPLSYMEVQILKYWIEEGYPENLKFNYDKMDSELAVLMQSNYQLDFTPKPYYEKIVVDRISDDRILELKGLGIRVQHLSEINNMLDVGIITGADPSLEEIWSLGEKVAFLDLSESEVSDEQMSEIGRLVNLVKLDLHSTQVNGSFLENTIPMEHLEILNLYDTKLTDKYGTELAAWSSLRRVYVWQSQMTKEGLANLQNLNGDLQIINGEDI